MIFLIWTIIRRRLSAFINNFKIFFKLFTFKWKSLLYFSSIIFKFSITSKISFLITFQIYNLRRWLWCINNLKLLLLHIFPVTHSEFSLYSFRWIIFLLWVAMERLNIFKLFFINFNKSEISIYILLILDLICVFLIKNISYF